MFSRATKEKRVVNVATISETAGVCDKTEVADRDFWIFPN